MSHVWMSHVTHIWQHLSCHTYEWVKWHVWMSHVTHIWKHLSYHTYEWVMSHVWISHMTRMNESCHTHLATPVMSHVWMSHVTHMNGDVIHIWLLNAVNQVFFFLSRGYVISHIATRHMNVIWLVRMRHVTHMNESCHKYEWVMSHIWMSHVTHMNESCHTYE